MQNLLNTPPPPGKRVKRIKRAAPRRPLTPIKRRQRTDVLESELDLFAGLPTQASIEDGRWVEHQPLRSLDSGVQ